MKDADFVVELGDVLVGAIAAALGGDYRLDPQMSFERIDVQGAKQVKQNVVASTAAAPIHQPKPDLFARGKKRW